MHNVSKPRAHNKGFTLIEVMVTVVIIALLSTIITVTYVRVQRDQTDSDRKSKVLILKQGLENYYDRNGEYPSRQIMDESTGPELSSLLKVESDGITLDSVVTDSATGKLLPVSTSSSFQGQIVYDGSSPGGSSDETNSCLYQTSGGCFTYTLSYKTTKETIETVKSEH